MSRRWIPGWAIVLVALMAIGTVWLRLSIIGMTYSISQTDRMIANLQQEKERAELKIAGLRSPRRLEILARTRFGLDQPKADQVIHLK